MEQNVILNQHRLRKISGGFSFIPHRFLKSGFLKSLSVEETLLYLFYVLASDRNGVSFYSDEKILEQLEIEIEGVETARKGLLDRGLLAYEKPYIQVLSLPSYPAPEMNPAHMIRTRLLEKPNDFK